MVSRFVVLLLVGCVPEEVGSRDTDPFDDSIVIPPSESDDSNSGGLLADIDTVLEGELVLSEVMVAPTDCVDLGAEYVEILNTGTRTIDLAGFTLTDGIHGAVLPSTDLGPGEMILGTTPTQQQCYGLVGDFSLQEITLSDSGDTLTLVGREPLDTLTWTSSVTQGAAQQRDGATWCDAPEPIGESFSDRGSPGVANPACP